MDAGLEAAQHTNIASTWSGVAGSVVTATYDLVAEICHTPLFGELQATSFADTQSKVDGT
ncbi:hypothetical protein [Corynebacterium nasicanis]|uniref:Uncharacterized protein n=1 Tax=Corynebacterium nasicanis TaxID=1448267 RepID=A0ABW1QA84_9CORY